ncbi:uncharacterized protein LOC113473257, partial [Diaphorina citri]|uniref:Uncharacterized protein LOC113473257 n=1 Tax=Diaphorina citri TaxID=121845 RepID=A0A3Q0JPJ5_DIACI
VGGVGGSGGGGGGLTILPLHQGERPYPGMPVLEDGLSSGHASDTENNNPTVLLMKRQISEIEQEIVVQRSHHSKLEEEVNGITGAGNKEYYVVFPPFDFVCKLFKIRDNISR